jgi:hypothetical protein
LLDRKITQTNKQQATRHKQTTNNKQQQTTNNKQQTTNNKQQTTNEPPPMKPVSGTKREGNLRQHD